MQLLHVLTCVPATKWHRLSTSVAEYWVGEESFPFPRTGPLAGPSPYGVGGLLPTGSPSLAVGNVRGPPVVRGAAADPPDAEGRRGVRGGAAAGGGALCVRRYHRHRPRAADHRVNALN